jgi:hypothetical protein
MRQRRNRKNNSTHPGFSYHEAGDHDPPLSSVWSSGLTRPMVLFRKLNVCAVGGGAEGKEFAKPTNRCKAITSTQNQFASARRPSTFLRWTNMHIAVNSDPDSWEISLWCNGLLSDCMVFFDCLQMNWKQYMNKHLTKLTTNKQFLYYTNRRLKMLSHNNGKC